ncbi:MAG: glutamate 5-kinase [Lachnospiraceae bacterium]|nr:glutamate 5-kinase [Lachnospiraceae bacterium]
MNTKKRVVIKVGTSTLTMENGALDLRTIDKLAQVLCAIHNEGYEVILVSSGAIAVGVNKMRLPEKPAELRMKQAAAAVGQCELMHIYDKCFSEYGCMVAQILLNGADVDLPEKRTNLSNTFHALLENGIIPIVNENDSVTYAEIESEKKVFGDNDMLSAIVSVLVDADELLILSDIEGLYDSNPRSNPDARLVHTVEHIDDKIMSLAQGAGTKRGTGGMDTKLQAAAKVTENGIKMHISFGRRPEYIYGILNGEEIGTCFLPQNK